MKNKGVINNVIKLSVFKALKITNARRTRKKPPGLAADLEQKHPLL